ncbi:MAG: hypothetical protein V7682_10855 [Cycloclasticus sp.]
MYLDLPIFLILFPFYLTEEQILFTRLPVVAVKAELSRSAFHLCLNETYALRVLSLLCGEFRNGWKKYLL